VGVYPLPMHCSSKIVIRDLGASDRHQWLCLRKQLWPESDEADALAWESREDATTLLAESSEDGVIGFAEVSVRPYADGCDTSPVAFLEGWFVHSSHRQRDVGRCLVQAAVIWAKKRGLHELASDSLLEDTAANLAHLRVGFAEVERSIKYRMSLDQSSTL
jgi:aminoglycoside 6'-N-acetyltransferase I